MGVQEPTRLMISLPRSTPAHLRRGPSSEDKLGGYVLFFIQKFYKTMSTLHAEVLKSDIGLLKQNQKEAWYLPTLHHIPVSKCLHLETKKRIDIVSRNDCFRSHD
jgi:hypothetical protein